MGKARVRWGPRGRLSASTGAWAGPRNERDAWEGHFKQASPPNPTLGGWNGLHLKRVGCNLWHTFVEWRALRILSSKGQLVQRHEAPVLTDSNKEAWIVAKQAGFSLQRKGYAYLFLGRRFSSEERIRVSVFHTEGWGWMLFRGLVISYCL